LQRPSDRDSGVRTATRLREKLDVRELPTEWVWHPSGASKEPQFVEHLLLPGRSITDRGVRQLTRLVTTRPSDRRSWRVVTRPDHFFKTPFQSGRRRS